MELSPIEIRVLGSLMEKARTTPEVYPLTLNGLVHACNQKTSRDPVSDYDEDEIMDTLDRLRETGLVMRVDMAGSRTAKFRENLSQKWELSSEAYALLTVLFLRGAQTPGQLRQRSDRLHPFASLEAVTSALSAMLEREDEPLSLVHSLDRAAGTKEVRYQHNWAPMEAVPELMPAAPAPPEPSPSPPPAEMDVETRLRLLEERVKDLESIIHENR